MLLRCHNAMQSAMKYTIPSGFFLGGVVTAISPTYILHSCHHIGWLCRSNYLQLCLQFLSCFEILVAITLLFMKVTETCLSPSMSLKDPKKNE